VTPSRIVLFCFLVLGLPSGVGAYPPEATPKPPWLRLWEKAKDLETQGSYREAKELYEALLKRPVPSARARRSIRRQYEALQVKIIFSGVETPDSFFHTVVLGDTLSELAKKYGTTVELLQKSNGIKGDRIYPGMKLKVTQAKFSMVVEKNSNHLTLLADDRPLKRYRVATGTEDSTPTGTFKIVNKLKDPTWFHEGSAIPPESPENILGSRWLGFDLAGYGIHGTTLPKTIGTRASKGCIRMLNEEVEEIYTLVPAGTRVTIKE